MRKYGFRDWESVLAALGHGGLKEGQILNKLIEAYEKEHKKEITDENELEELEDAMALQNISNMPARVKCAVLAWHTLKEALKK